MICRRWQQKEYTSRKTNASLMSSTLKHAAKRRPDREHGNGDGEWKEGGRHCEEAAQGPAALLAMPFCGASMDCSALNYSAVSLSLSLFLSLSVQPQQLNLLQIGRTEVWAWPAQPHIMLMSIFSATFTASSSCKLITSLRVTCRSAPSSPWGNLPANVDRKFFLRIARQPFYLIPRSALA